MTDVTLFGVNPKAHHLVNVFFHAVNCVLLFLLLQAATLRVGRSAMVAALFAVHPLNVETVAWISERKSLLCTFFFFLALGAYSLYVRQKSVLRYLLLMLLFLFALMAKPMVITFPALLLIIDYWPLLRIPTPLDTTSTRDFFGAFGRCIFEKLPLLLLSAASIAITFVAQRSGGAVLTLSSLPLRFRLQNAVYSCAAYLFKAVWPVNLAVFYPHPQGTLPPILIALSFLGLLLITGLAWRYRAVCYLPAGWLWYLVSLSPVIGILQVGKQAMADRYAYTSMLGIFVIVVWGIADAAERIALPKRSLYLLSGGVLVILASVTQLQISYWHSSITLFRHALDVTQNNSIAEINLGQAYLEQGRIDLAEPLLRSGVRRSPEYNNAHYNLALIFESEQRYDEAIGEYKEAIAHSTTPSDLAIARDALASLYLSRNQLPEALAQYELVTSVAPNDPRGYFGRGLVFFQQANYESALNNFLKADSITSSPQALYWIGRCHEARNENAEAIQAYERVLRIAPQLSEASDRIAHLKQATK
jgi:tetratricopeptide (TPR) repeat protein